MAEFGNKENKLKKKYINSTQIIPKICTKRLSNSYFCNFGAFSTGFNGFYFLAYKLVLIFQY